MIARALGYWVGQTANKAAERKARWAQADAIERANTDRVMRALSRITLSATCLVPLGYCLWKLWHAHGDDKLFWFELSIPTVAAFAFVLRHIGSPRGFFWGFWLWLLSIGMIGGAAAGLFAALGTLSIAMNWSLDINLLVGIVALLIVAAVFIPCYQALKRIDGQAP